MPKQSFAAQPRTALPGSHKPALANATGAKPIRPATSVTVSVLLRRKAPVDPAQRLTRAQFKSQHGPDPAALKAVLAFAQEYALEATPPADGSRTVQLTGTAKQMQAAFGVTLTQATVDGAACRLREGDITLPDSLHGMVEAVLGLDNRPQARAHFRVAKQSADQEGIVHPRATSASFTPVQVAQLYGLPANSTATGQTIALLELGGGFKTADVKAYFQSLSLPVPNVVAVSVDGGKNKSDGPNGADGEVMLDIEVAAAVAPGANIVVYFAPNTDQGFIDAISAAVHDTTHKPSVLSISWGGPEDSWTAQARTALDQACQAAASLGITVLAAAGDNGSSDGESDGKPHVDFPASSPHVLACGGTKLTGTFSGAQNEAAGGAEDSSAVAPASSNARRKKPVAGNPGSGTTTATIQSEVVWNEQAANEGATGGGISTAFPQPTWQSAIAATKQGRGVPDVSGNADPATGYQVRVDGQSLVIGGTSAVAPLWAGLLAVINAQSKTTVGFVQPKLYATNAATAFHDITQGNNGAYKAAKGWDACTGLGSPNFPNLLALLAPTKATAKPTKGKAERVRQPSS